MSTRFNALVLLILAACRSAPTPDAAQPPDQAFATAVIERATNCEKCELVFTALGVLGQASDSFTLDAGSTVAMLPNGRFVVGPTTSSSEALIFDSIGAPARRLGRAGQGPGEISDVRVVLPWRADSVLLFGSQRLTFLSATSGTGRTVLYPRGISGFDILPLSNDGVIVVNSYDPGSAQFVEIDAEGQVHLQIGEEKPANPRFDADGRAATLGPAVRPHAFWSGAKRYRYHLDLWDLSGERVQSIDRAPSWFVPSDSASSAKLWAEGPGRVRPFPILKTVRETANGMLCVMFTIAAKDWAPDPAPDPLHPSPSGEAGGARRIRPELYDGVINLLDRGTGELVLSQWTDVPLRGFINDTIAYDHREAADGRWEIALYRVELRRQ